MTTDQKSSRGVVIGPLTLAGSCVLAPMSGITDVYMRRLAVRFGASLVVSEMVASDDFVRGAQEARLRSEGAGIHPHSVQLAGCDAAWMGEAARLAEANGADIIDINMGCPAKRVTGGWAGSALMRDLDHASRLIDAVVAAVAVPVTLKMRLGWDSETMNAPALARSAQDLGVTAITVHGRTRQQFYKGRADWRAIKAVRHATTLPLIANGDIETIEDAQACREQSGADAVMVGRAALGRPWLAGKIAAGLAGSVWREPSAAEKTAAIREHYEGLLSLYGERMGVRHARKHLAAYSEEAGRWGYGLSAADRERLVTTTSPAEVLGIIDRMFAHPNQAAA